MNQLKSLIDAEAERQWLDLKSHCDRLLLTASAKGTYPTPVDRIVESAKLVKSGDLSLLEIPKDPLPTALWRKIGISIEGLISKVKAGLFPREKTIFINPNLHKASIPFATLHECIHHILPWQQKSCTYLDNEKTFDPRTSFWFEREANRGAGYLLWQGDDYIKQALDMPITTATPVSLAEQYGGSVHSSMRYYVENHRESLMLLVLRRNQRALDPRFRFDLQYAITSPTFQAKFGRIRTVDALPQDHFLMKRSHTLDTYWEGEARCRFNQAAYTFLFFGYETPYNIFVLLTPKRNAGAYGKSRVFIRAPDREHKAV